MVCLGFEPRVAGWKAQIIPLSYGGAPWLIMFDQQGCGRIWSNHDWRFYEGPFTTNFPHPKFFPIYPVRESHYLFLLFLFVDKTPSTPNLMSKSWNKLNLTVQLDSHARAVWKPLNCHFEAPTYLLLKINSCHK